jgi:large repetitive protein
MKLLALGFVLFFANQAFAQITLQPITVSALAGTTVTVDLLENASSVDGSPLNVYYVQWPNYGDGQIYYENGRQLYRYTPRPYTAQSELLTYAVMDQNGNYNYSTLQISYYHGNPIAVNDSGRQLVNTGAIYDVLANDISPDGLPLRLMYFYASHGMTNFLEINGRRQIQYVPNPGFRGTEMITYSIDDGYGAFAMGMLMVEVYNNDPVAVPDVASTVSTVPIFIDVLANDFDIDGHPLQLAYAMSGWGGQAEVVEQNGRRVVKFTPLPYYLGFVWVEYDVMDGNGGYARGRIEVTIANNPPVTTPDEARTLVDTPVVIDVTANDLSHDGRILVLMRAGYGNLGYGEVFYPNDGSLPRVRYTPFPGRTGTETIQYYLMDYAGGEVAGNLTVTIYNNLPVVVDDSAATTLNTPVIVDILSNDYDSDGHKVNFVSFETSSKGVMIWDISTMKATYYPAQNTFGQEIIYYNIDDGHGGTARGKVTVDVKYSSPVATADYGTVRPLRTVRLDVLANDSSPHALTLKTVSVTQPSHGKVTINADGSLNFQSSSNRKTVETFIYKISDGISTAQGTVRVDVR